MKNIAIIIHSLTGGGAERIAGLLSLRLSKIYNVYLLLLEKTPLTYDHAGTVVYVGDGEWYEIEEKIKKYKIKYKIDCSISFLMEMNLYNLRTRCSENVIISHRCSIGESDLSFFEREKQIIRDYYGEADNIVACSYGNKYDLVHYYNIDETIITPIYNFVDKQKILCKSTFTLDNSVMNFIGESKLILNVGRLEPQKNQTMLLRQFQVLVKANYDVKLIILGKGSLEQSLKKLANDLGIADKVRFETYCKNPFPYYRAATFLACSTDFEGLPNVVLEAMTLGLPVVSVDCLSGPRELIKMDREYSVRTKGVELCANGVLVEKNSTDVTGETKDFAQGMKLLLDNPILCETISKNEKKYMDTYDNNAFLKQWIDLIEKAPTHTSSKTRVPLQFLKDMRQVVIYGAGDVGCRILNYIRKMGMKFDFLAFAVTHKMEGIKEVEGIPVYQIDELEHLKEKVVVIVAVSSRLEREIVKQVKKYGFKYVYSDLYAW